MKTIRRVCSAILAAIMAVTVFSGCEKYIAADAASSFDSFRGIPGLTIEEVAAVEELQNSVGSFVYAVNRSTEAFYDENGEVNGFAALFCRWLSELFDIPFIPKIVEWDELIEGLENETIDFTGELTANAERRRKYIMTDDIAQRQIVCIRLNDDAPPRETAHSRPPRYGFLDGSTTVDDVRKYESNEFEEFYLDDYSLAYEMLASGEIDAFFEESPAEAAFDVFGEVEVSLFFPIIYSPVSLSTHNPELKYIIEIVDKALANGAIYYLTRLYNQGHQDYLRHKLMMLLTDEELEYIKNTEYVPYAAETTNYPVSFYDSRTKQWEGIALEVIDEIERISGLKFARQNNEHSHWPELFGMLGDGKVSMITELIPSDERAGEFLWAGKKFLHDYTVLISKADYHDIAVNEILYIKTGVVRDTANSSMFKRWFQNHRSMYEYENTNDAFDALERGDIDMVIASEHQLLIMTNYRELVGYKSNYVFPFYFDSTFGFNKNEAVLCSIVTKAMKMIDVESISGRWMRRTYDYRVRLAQDRLPFMIGVGMLFIGLIFAVIMIVRNRREGMRLETLVDFRTNELSKNQRQLEDLLRRNEIQLLKHNLMAHATNIGLWDMEVVRDDPVNLANTFIWSDEFRNLLGFTDENDFPNVLASWSERLHPEDRERAIDAFLGHLTDTTDRTPFDIECRLQRKNGEYGYFRASGAAIRDPDGDAVRVAGALLDITESKNLLIDLETEKFMLQTMFDSIPDLIFCKDADSNYTRCNVSLLRYFNLGEDDLIGKDDFNGLGLPDETALEYRDMDRLVMSERKMIKYEEVVPSADGNDRLFETNKVPLVLNGAVTGIMGIARDITERKAMEDAAQSANRAKTEFLTNMSHEIRTPMNAIVGMSELLGHEELSARQMDFVNDINNSAHALLGIINDILDMSKIEAGKLELQPVDYSFDQFMDNIVSMFSHIASKKGLEFLTEISDEAPDCLYGDDIRLRQVLTNICGNAIKFTETGHVKLSVRVVGNVIKFMIEDTGSGIRKEDMPKLFRAFEQVDKTKNRSVVGTGLGLPICKSFVELMGGEIDVESEYGYGSAFIITLPIVAGNPQNIHKIKDIETIQSISAPDARVLVTDDNAFNLKVASGLLSLMGITAETADSGDMAVELVKLNDYDIVFMDHMMPEKDGIETVHEIRKLGGKYEDLTIIALTANALKGAREMFFENGFNDFIAKPINTDELREMIKYHLPPEKVFIKTGRDEQHTYFGSEGELFRKAVVIFAKENRDTHKNIIDALESGDGVTAHRITHTLKSSAGFLGKKELEEAAFSLELSLQNQPYEYSERQLEIIDRELEKALREYEPFLKEAEYDKTNAVTMNDEELAALLAEIKPLLKNGDFGATEYVKKLQSITGMDELAEVIDDYDFEAAYKIIESFQND